MRRPAGLDFVTLDYADVLEELINIKKSLLELGGEVELIIKPHPSSNYLLLKNILKESGISNLRDRKSTRLNSSHIPLSRMPSSA